MRKHRPNTARNDSPHQRRLVAIALASLMAGTTAGANPPLMNITRDANRAVHAVPRAAEVRGMARGDASWRTAPVEPTANPVAQPYPPRFSGIPDLHSRSYLQDLSIPTLGGDGRGIRDQSPTEQFIRQARKEGLPLARLWQNDQALLSLGLNRKGKPGLWIIQKIR